MVHRGIVEAVDKNGEIFRPKNGKLTEEEESGKKQISNGLFYKVWQESGLERLDDAEIGFLVRIMKYVDYRDNTIRLGEEVMTVKEMAEVTGREYTRLSKLVKGLVERKVMGKHSTEIVEYVGRRGTVYTVNPYIMCKGRMLNEKIKSYYVGG